MNYILVSKVLQSLKYLNSEPPYQTESNSLEVIVLDKVVKIDREQLERDHQVLPKDYVILDPDDVE